MSVVEETARRAPEGESVVLPILPLRETVVFPGAMTPLAVGQERSVRLVDEAVAGDLTVALVTSRSAEEETPDADDLYEVGTSAVVHKMVRVPDGTLRVLVQGLDRMRLEEIEATEPYLTGRFTPLPDVVPREKEAEALARSVESLYGRIIALAPYLPEELGLAAANAETPGALANLIAATMRLRTEERQDLLETPDVEERLRKLTVVLSRELEVFELGTKLQSQVQEEMDKSQREYFLRQQLKAIQEELGEGDEQQAELAELRAQVEAAGLPEDAERAARRELDRLAKLPPAAAEYGVIRTYLEWILSLPWSTATEDQLDLQRARKILDEDHYDLEKIKERIVEHLAVQKLRRELSGPILCFVGPPGVGKTSLGQSIARALGRKFVRISVGGVRDEAEIRGHRRTYIGAMPGTVIRALRDAESRNPVFMIDEIDKMGADWRGDPASAMLEVLDPAQNSHFRDHYLDLPFDLSQVLFICTANQLDPIPSPLRDRMEIIPLSGYTEDEKVGIARRYLVPKQVEAHGLDRKRVTISESALRLLVREYTREAGVRNLDREIAALCRKAAREIAEGKRKGARIDERRVRTWLGRRRFPADARKRTSDPGVATGLAVTAVGGDVLFVEATAMPGRGRLTVTGQIGDVMRESAQAALSWVRGHARDLGLESDWFEDRDVHIHVPAGAVPKDGPSAGTAMATALASLATGIPVSEDVAMTGEITLTGQVLPIGGVKEKVLAAQRAGISTVVLPRENEPDLDDLQPEVREAMRFVLADTIGEVLEAAFPGAPVLEFSRAAPG
ncbi:MAG TPA: endopeptidase La [Gaiellaceae bacterium]|nr:endopeptidase La [Gaiellaceae bacterium]